MKNFKELIEFLNDGQLEEAKENSGTYFITAYTNDKAKLIAKEAKISFCKETADMVEKKWKDMGFIVKKKLEK